MILRVIPIALILCLTCFAQAQAASTLCYTVAACVLGANLGPGPGGAGIEGQAQNTYGVLGISNTGVGTYGRSTTLFGVLGVTEGTGVAGVYGYDATGGTLNAGVLGNSFSGHALAAITARGIAVFAVANQAGTAVYGTSTHNPTAFGPGSGPQGYGGEFTVNQGTATYSSTGVGIGLYASSDGTPVSNDVAPLIGTAAEFAASGYQTDILVGLGSTTCGTCLIIDGEGNEELAGTLTENASPFVRTRTASGDVTTYGTRSASPTLEDTGTATLSNGTAFVALDKTFASAIAPGYMVFVTPHDDSNSLYTKVGLTGFTVRESKGGRSTLTFDYRIVAKPLDAKGARLAAMAPLKRIARVKPIVPKMIMPTLPRTI